MTNNYGENINENVSTNTGSGSGSGWQSVEPTTVDNDGELQDALDGNEGTSSQDDRALGFDAQSWGGMQSGAIQHDSQEKDKKWMDNIPEAYRGTAYNWSNQQGMLKITPLQQRQKFTYTTVAYIAHKTQEPKIQIFPISDVNVVPHQITFDFYDTTEGRIGVSNAVEIHMNVECDVYLTDLLAQYWIFGDDNSHVMGIDIFKNYKKQWWDAVDNGEYLNFEGDLENTSEFAEFRSTFLQQHSGWVCRFASHTFGVFQGVLTDVSYSIGSGESFAKWHLKFEEAIFMDESYSDSGQKPSESTVSDGSQEDSGSANNQE